MNDKKDCILEKEDYIIKELQDGTQIKVTDLHREVLTIMDEIHRICVKHGVRYGLMAGSALGIVNYKGFIPWDDDIDVCVLKQDWAKFIAALQADLNPEFYFQCFETNPEYNVLIPSMKIRKRHTYVKEVNTLLSNKCKSGDGVYIDLVYFDAVSANRYIDELYRLPIHLMWPFAVLLENLGHNPLRLKKAIRAVSDLYSKRHQNSGYIYQPICIPWEKPFKDPIFLEKDVLPFKLYEFEGRHYYSFNNIEAVLLKRYGPNCLKKWDGTKWVETLPVEKRTTKHILDISLLSDTLDE